MYQLPPSAETRLGALLGAEADRFAASHPRSAQCHARAAQSLLNGVPMNWMEKWPGAYPIVAERAEGARLWDVDGNEYVDLCLGDTGAMAGHCPPPTVRALAEQIQRGWTTMLPSPDAARAGELLAERFGLPIWQIVMTATDANRFILRLARWLTDRQRILVFNWCYHGTVDETMAVLVDGEVRPREGVVAGAFAPAQTTTVVEFNDLEAIERELASGEIACVLAEPALTNIGIVLPDPGFHTALRELTRRTGTLLVLDETHTFSTGPGGATKAWGLDPDLMVIGKTIAGGFPAAAYGMTAPIAQRVSEAVREPGLNLSGIGGTLSGNALAVAAIVATLGEYFTPGQFEEMTRNASRWSTGVQQQAEHAGFEFHVSQLGARAEYHLGRPSRNGGAAAVAGHEPLENYLHLFALNRGVLLTPFHNMALMSPVTTPADVDRHTEVFAEALGCLTR